MTSETFAILKPDAVERGLVGPILHQAATGALQPSYMVMLAPPESFWHDLYRAHEGKPFYDDLVTQMMSGPVVLLMLTSDYDDVDVVEQWRTMMGATNPRLASPHSIRGQWGGSGPKNLVHGSDSPAAALAEKKLFLDMVSAHPFRSAR